jgi:hypothetical protein
MAPRPIIKTFFDGELLHASSVIMQHQAMKLNLFIFIIFKNKPWQFTRVENYTKLFVGKIISQLQNFQPLFSS